LSAGRVAALVVVWFLVAAALVTLAAIAMTTAGRAGSALEND